MNYRKAKLEDLSISITHKIEDVIKSMFTDNMDFLHDVICTSANRIAETIANTEETEENNDNKV